MTSINPAMTVLMGKCSNIKLVTKAIPFLSFTERKEKLNIFFLKKNYNITGQIFRKLFFVPMVKFL